MPYIKKMVMHGFKSFAKETEIPFSKGMNTVVGPNGSGKSCSYDTIVTLANGQEVEIGKLVEEELKKASEAREIKKLKDGIYINGNNSVKIISLNKETMKTEKKVVSKFIKRDGEVIYRIRTRTGKEVKATGCHPVIVFKEAKIESSLIKDLQKGSFIAAPRMMNIEGENNFDKDIARLLGYIIGDGYIAKDRIELVNKDNEVLEDFINIIREKFNVEMKERHEKNITRIYIRDKKFVSYIRELFYKNYPETITSKIKKIPEILLCSNKEIIRNLLAGLFDTDGSVRKDASIIEFCTKNKDLARQIQGLLLRFGIMSKIKKRFCCASNTKNKVKREYFYLYIYGFENLKRFLENIPLKIKYKSEAIKLSAERQIKANPNTDILPHEINFIIRDVVKDIGIKIKPIRKEYPSLAAYMENRCAPSREGILKFINLFENKLNFLSLAYKNLSLDQINLVRCMDELNISGWHASKQIGLNKGIIRTHWATNRFHAKPENLQKFYDFIKGNLALRIIRATKLIRILNALATSDIYWDEIVSIEKLEKESYVYDLTIDNNHNFIANNLFVHNSNISDALCFVLGRLGMKSMRATRAANLIFMGTKAIKPAHEASVEIIFDNSDKRFNIDKEEISIKRIVRSNGQGIYKIGNETKTRQEILELLAQADIDPNGFNIILQGEIDSLVKMHPEERRGIIEEVAGISVYEKRKEKSLHELEKTEEKLKEIGTILRERGAFLNGLEEDRKNALKFKQLEETVKRCKASIIFKDKAEKEKGVEQISSRIDGENKKISKVKESIDAVQQEISRTNEKIEMISRHIQDSSGLHSEKLREDVSNLKVEVGGLCVRKEGLENSLDSLLRRREELKKSILSEEKEIEELKKRSPAIAKKQDEIRKKKSEFERAEELRKKFYTLKSDIASCKGRISDKKDMLRRIQEDSDSSFRQVEELSRQLFDKNTGGNDENIKSLKEKISSAQKEIEELGRKEISAEKSISMSETEIRKLEEIKSDVSKIDICPLCKSKITEEHVGHVTADCNKKISEISKLIGNLSAGLENIKSRRKTTDNLIQSLKLELSKREIDSVKIQGINDKAGHIKKLENDSQGIKKEIEELENKRKELERLAEQQSGMEERYENLKLNIEEISSRTEESIDIEISSKERELDKIRFIVKKSHQDEQDIKEQVSELGSEIDEKQEMLDRLEESEKKLTEQFKKHLAERNMLQDEIREKENLLINRQHELRGQEDVINGLRIAKAQLDAELKSLSEEFLQFQIGETEIISASREKISERLAKAQEDLIRIGNVNMRAIEVYDSVKKEYDIVLEKAQKLEAEKNEVMKIIQEIDNKKKKTFNKTLDALNMLFERNFAQLSVKGTVSLEPESKEDPFSAGVSILVKVGKGKYLDATSLSGGEQTLVALSLIFAIQEYKPYSFYVFDEIDAALDKRNSERLADLIKRYMKSGQYIIITHNDSIITESDVVYGVSMYEGVSKIYSLPV